MSKHSTETKYSITVNQQDFQISKDEIDSLDAIETSNKNYHVVYDNQSLDAHLIDSDFASRTYKVKVNSNTYNIQINNSLDNLIKELGFEVGANKQVNSIKAPMPGLILDVNVKIGDNVEENHALLVLEAMKMENVILSPRNGVIKSIAVEKGNAVDKNQLLIEFE